MKKYFNTLFLVALLLPLTACKEEGTISYDYNMDEERLYQVEVETYSREDDLGSQEEHTICVAISGCVPEPGVYIMPKGSRIYELINAAGGIMGEGDITSLNIVSVLSDGQSVYVKARGEENSPEFEDMESDTKKININTANQTELQSLSGIGASKAKAIITYREKNGAFKSIDDLKKVSGIKEGTFNAIKDEIRAD